MTRFWNEFCFVIIVSNGQTKGTWVLSLATAVGSRPKIVERANSNAAGAEVSPCVDLNVHGSLSGGVAAGHLRLALPDPSIGRLHAQLRFADHYRTAHKKKDEAAQLSFKIVTQHHEDLRLHLEEALTIRDEETWPQKWKRFIVHHTFRSDMCWCFVHSTSQGVSGQTGPVGARGPPGDRGVPGTMAQLPACGHNEYMTSDGVHIYCQQLPGGYLVMYQHELMKFMSAVSGSEWQFIWSRNGQIESRAVVVSSLFKLVQTFNSKWGLSKKHHVIVDWDGPRTNHESIDLSSITTLYNWCMISVSGVILLQVLEQLFLRHHYG